MFKKIVIFIVIIPIYFHCFQLCWAKKGEAEYLKDFAGGAKIQSDPHNVLECTNCHLKKPDTLIVDVEKISFKFGGDFTRICLKCHSSVSDSHHPVRVEAGMKVPKYLILGDGKFVSCRTCHRIHSQTTKYHLLRGFEDGRYSNREELCYDCHAAKFYELNPHKSQIGLICFTCHVSEPVETDSQVFVLDMMKVCDFCHNVREREHPLNIDATLEVPKELPRTREGIITCSTCHDPHGSSVTVNFLRKEYVEYVEKKKIFDPHINKFSCLDCHLTPPRLGMDTAKTITLKYRGDIVLLCNSCHGVEDKCHPVNIIPSEFMDVAEGFPLDKEGKITCITCHDTDCGGENPMKIRGAEKYESKNDVCFTCHDREEFVDVNPHEEREEKDKCGFCHDTFAIAEEGITRVMAFLTDVRMICIRCHPEAPHPAQTSHLLDPTMDIPKELKLDQRRRITCSTCHDPHMNIDAVESYFRIEGGGHGLCIACHKM